MTTADAKPELKLALNPALDVAGLAAQFRETGRLRVENVLSPSSADRLLDAIKTHDDWYYTYYDGDKLEVRPVATVNAMTPDKRAAMWGAVMDGARRGFQYLYEYYPVTYKVEQSGVRCALDAVEAFVNSDAFLDFMRAITGVQDLTYADVSVSNFGPSHFLLEHDDSNAARNRDAAYVLNMTPEWRPDWGGYLAFYNDEGDIVEGLAPRFNALHVLRTPQPHGVTFVAPYATARRYSLVGWVWRGRRPEPGEMVY